MSSLEEYPGHDVIQSDVILPQTDSDESSAALETSGGGGAEGTEKDCIVDTGCQETILGVSVGGADGCGRPSFGVSWYISVGCPTRSVGA